VNSKFTNRAYWACTTLLSALMLLSGAGDLLRLQAFVEDLRRLGYPGYLLTVLGTAKLLGVSALLYPGGAASQGMGVRRFHLRPGRCHDLAGALRTYYGTGHAPDVLYVGSRELVSHLSSAGTLKVCPCRRNVGE
jgi:hypothetical protein